MGADRRPTGRTLHEELDPGLDPMTAARSFAHLPHLLVLESVERNARRGRYSFVTADPVLWWERRSPGVPFDELFREPAGWLDRCRRGAIPELPPFQGGLAGLFGYELNTAIERVPTAPADEFDLPLLALGLYDWVIAFDHLQGRAWLIATDVAGRAEATMKTVRGLLNEPGGPLPDPPASDRLPPEELAPQYPLPRRPGVSSNFSREGYLRAVDRAVEYVHAGDCFQVNISQRLLALASEHPLELYRRLSQRNPAPFAGYLDAGRLQVVSSSPERFLELRDRVVSTRPIKGTRPCFDVPEADAFAALELSVSPKDHAENVMIVDLLRNDLGRVCEFGSVTVPAVCEIESFRFVHHLISEVRGRLRPGVTPLDLIRAAFPGGSVTGAPKVRAMEIIAGLEPTVRGPYCGSLGYVGFDGSMDTNILIRTFTVSRGWVQFPVGGGVVADSTPESEYDETMHKAEGLFRALP